MSQARSWIAIALPVAVGVVLLGCSEYNVQGERPTVEAENPVPKLVITPTSHDFGTLDIPCGDTVEITLSSEGTEAVVVEELSFDGPELLTLDNGHALPLTLAPGQKAKVSVLASPTLPTEDEFATLTVVSNDPGGDQVADFAARAEGLMVMEAFTEPGIPPVDILFMIDQSCSMKTLADDNLTQGMPAFINELQNVADWQLIQVNQPDGCANGGIMDPSTPNAASLLAEHAFDNFPPFALNNYMEKLLEHAELSLSLTDAAECNDGFLRQGASLHIIIASDEVEQSNQPWSTWLTAYEGYVTHPEYVTVSGILNLTSDLDCSGSDSSAGPDGYLEIINATGGVALDICQPGWGTQLTDIATATVAGIRVYNLSDNAVQGSLTVLVNGKPATDWEFSNDTNSVTINAPPIGEGDIVEIGYGIHAECSR